MRYFDIKFDKIEQKMRRTYEIDISLFEFLEQLTGVYDTTIPELINFCIKTFVGRINENNNIPLYKKSADETFVRHTMLIRESNLNALGEIKQKYGIPINRLVNTAIYMMKNDK